MKKLAGILSVSFLLLLSAFTLKAAQDTTEININATFIDYVNFIGSANGVSKFFTVDEIQPQGNSSSGPRLSLGTLGLESNSVGDCDIQFVSKNNFRLRHIVSNQLLTNYRIIWKGNNVKNLPNRELTLPCNSTATDFVFQAVARFQANVQAGIYQDILTLTVTTQ